MIRARNAIRPDAACHSADVLTPTERAADRIPPDFSKPEGLIYRSANNTKTWGDIPEIRAILNSLRSKP